MNPAARLTAAAILLTAAMLKTVELAVLGGTGGPLELTRPLHAAAIFAEMALAGWLASGWQPRWAAGVGGLIFLAFAGIAGWLWSGGAGSCGCFGPLSVPPAMTMTMDLLLAAWLGWSMRAAAPQRPRKWMMPVSLTTGVMAAMAVGLSEPRQATLGHEVLGNQEAEVDAGVERVLFFRDDCEHCRQVVPRILAEDATKADRWRLVDVTSPPVPRSFVEDLALPAHAQIVRQPDAWLPTPQYLVVEQGQERPQPIPEPSVVIDPDAMAF